MPANARRLTSADDRRPRPRVPLHLGPILLILALALSTACAPASTARRASPQSASVVPGAIVRSQDIIGRDQLMGTGETSMFDALQRIRADLFRPRRAEGLAPDDAVPAVYVNEFYQGTIDVLRGLTTDVVRDVQVVRSIDTSQRFGRAHPAGALMVRLQLR